MSTQNIVFIVLGIIFIIGSIPIFWAFWHSYKNPVSENVIAYSNWFMSWIRKNKATFLLLIAIIVLLCGVGFIGIPLGLQIGDPTDIQ